MTNLPKKALTIAAFVAISAGSFTAIPAEAYSGGVPVNSYLATKGQAISGNIYSLPSNDNNYLVVKSTTSGAKKIQRTEFTFTTSTPVTQAMISVRVKSSAPSTNWNVKLYNYSTGNWDLLAIGTIGTNESGFSFPIMNFQKYVNNGNAKLAIESAKNVTHTISYDRVFITGSW
jgi:hypothetical protein